MADPFFSAGAGIKNSAGAMFQDYEGTKASYVYSSLTNTPAATPTDVLTLTGSASKVIRVRALIINGISTAAGAMPYSLIRRSTANSGGTATTPTPAKRDGLDPAASAVVTLYTANPASLGTVAETHLADRLAFQPVATVAQVANENLFGGYGEKGIVLRGATDILALNFGGAAVPTSGVLDLTIIWTEE